MIRDIPLEILRKNIGIVLQEPFLYSRTIRENISAANPDATFEEVRNAAKIACVDDAIIGFADAVSYTHLDVYKRQEQTRNRVIYPCPG